MATAKLFRNGRTERVPVRREGLRVVLEPLKRRSWPKGYWQSWGKLSSDFQVPEPLPSGGRAIDLDAE